MVEVNIYYQRYRERMEINVIGGQKQSVILGMLWLACHKSEIEWRIEEVKITRCLKECDKQQRPKQKKSEWQKQKDKEKKKEEKEQKKEKKKKKGKNSRSKEDSRRMGDLRQGRKSSQI